MIDLSQFSKFIKTKYPEYQSVPDDDLTQRVLAKFPEYSKVVLPSNALPEVGQGLLDNQTTQEQPDTSLGGLGHAAYLKGVGGMEIAPEQEQGLAGMVQGGALASMPIGGMVNAAKGIPRIKVPQRAGGGWTMPSKGQAARSAMNVPEAEVVVSPLELELSASIKQSVPARQMAVAKLAETNPIAALKSGLPVKQWAKLDQWLAETKATLGDTPEALAMVEAKAKNLIDQAMGILPTLQNRPGFIGPKDIGKPPQQMKFVLEDGREVYAKDMLSGHGDTGREHFPEIKETSERDVVDQLLEDKNAIRTVIERPTKDNSGAPVTEVGLELRKPMTEAQADAFVERVHEVENPNVTVDISVRDMQGQVGIQPYGIFNSPEKAVAFANGQFAKAQATKPQGASVTTAQPKVQTVKELRKELNKTPNAEPWAANKVLEVLNDPKTPARMPKEGFLNVLRNKQVKPEQLEWDGLNDFLKGKDSITKAEVQKFVKENGLNLTEIDKGDGPLGSTLFFKQQGYTPETFNKLPLRDQQRLWEAYELMKDAPEYKSNATSYGHMKDLQLPGGKNYREKRFQLPIPKNASPLVEIPPEIEAILERMDKGLPVPVGQRLAREAGYELKWDRDTDLPYVIPKGKVEHAPFKSKAYPEEGIVAETRYTDRTIDKEKVGYLEEVQSHMHQAGRAQGYNSNLKELPEGYKVVTADTIGKNPGMYVTVDKNNLPISSPKSNGMADTRDGAKEIALGILNKGIPDAPFKAGKHVELVMKRMVRQFIEEGKDGMGWTTGQVQKDRYNLAKQVSEIQAGIKDDGKYMITILDNDGERKALTVAKEDLPATVGKDLAEKISNQTADNKAYKGLDLKIGGEWADNLYDKQMVNFANKFFGKWGAKVEKRKMMVHPEPKNIRELEATMENMVTGADSFEEAKQRFINEHNWDGLTEEMYEDITNMDAGRASTPRQWAAFLKKEMKKPYEIDTWYMKFTPELIRAALKQGFPLYAVTGAVGAGAGKVSLEDKE